VKSEKSKTPGGEDFPFRLHGAKGGPEDRLGREEICKEKGHPGAMVAGQPTLIEGAARPGVRATGKE